MAEPLLTLAMAVALSASTWQGAFAQDAVAQDAVAQENLSDNSSNACVVNESENGSNGSANCSEPEVPCITDCCSTHIRREAYLACKEFMDFGLTEEICRSWENYVQTDCEFWCSNCTALGLTIYGQCVFYMGMLVPFSVAMDFCMTARYVMQNARCPAACVDKVLHCQGPEYESCNAQCGNYHRAPGIPIDGCDCYRDRKYSHAPDVCTGETVNEGLIPGSRGLEHSCTLMPRTCMSNRIGTACGLYTYCDVDVCVVKNITCPFRGDCRSDGVCNKVNGKCYYLAKPNGVLCTDFTDWTHDDVCVSGECIGIEDKCMHYSTDCSTLNPCLEPHELMTYQGVMTNCDTGSGSCMFKPRPDGTFCASEIGGVIDGACKKGVCRRISPDKCANRPECPNLGPCYNKSLCDSYTGECIPVYMPDGHPCTDRRSDTHGDKCVQGKCLGGAFSEPTFQTKGVGDCIQHVPVLSECKKDCEKEDGRPVPRYYRDLLEADECEERCKYDPECIAYSYGYHVCSIYGTTRTENPEGWILETTAALIEHEVTCWEKTEGEVWDFIRIVREYLFNLTVFMMLFTPISFTYCMFYRGIHSSYRRSLGIEKHLVDDFDDDDEPNPHSDLSPRGGATMIAQGVAMESCWDDLDDDNLQQQQLEQYPNELEQQKQQKLSPEEQDEAVAVLQEAQAVEPPRDPRGEVEDPDEAAAEGNAVPDAK